MFCAVAQPYCLFLCVQVPNTEQQWKAVAADFLSKWNFPNCLGALDGKHVAILPPPNSGSQYYNYKHFNSIILMALVDAAHKFLYVDVGSYGRFADGGVFNNCTLAKGLNEGSLNIPGDCQLPGFTNSLPYVIVADDAFALKTNIMKPYCSRGLTQQQRIFNYRLSRARRVVENAFGILSNRFKVFGRPIALAPEKVEVVVMTACCLHNFLLRDVASASDYMPPDDLPDCTLPPLAQKSGNRVSRQAMYVRDQLCSYVNSTAGAVNWQTEAIS